MTIAIGVVCKDGVVVATDSMGSSGRIATHIDKAHALNSSPIIWAVSGSTYVSQQMEEEIGKRDASQVGDLTPRELADHLRPVVATAYQVPSPPPGAEEEDVSVEALFLGWKNNDPSLIHLPADLAPIECSPRGFVAIGSGHEYAMTSKATLGHYFSKTRPSAQTGLLLAYRIVSTVCQVSSWGVGLPVQMAIADDAGARLLSSQELEEVQLGCQRWLSLEASVVRRGGLEGPMEGDLPSIDELSQGIAIKGYRHQRTRDDEEPNVELPQYQQPG